MMRYFLFFMLVGTFFVGCKKSNNYSAREMASKHSKWFIESMDGLKTDSSINPKPSISFDLIKNTSNGQSGCNDFTSNIVWSWKFMQFGAINSTKIACKGASALFETTLYTTLTKIEKAKPKGEKIELTDGDGGSIIVLAPAN